MGDDFSFDVQWILAFLFLEEEEVMSSEIQKELRLSSLAGFQCHAIQNRSNKNQNRSIDKVQNLGNERT